MDQPLDDRFVRRRTIRRLVTGGGIVAALAIGVFWLPGLVSPSVKRSTIRLSVVDLGPLDASISATGTVVPEVELVLSSPVDARVLRVLKRAGSAVRAGEPIIQLDLSESVLAAEKLAGDLAIKSNLQTRATLSLQNTVADLSSQVEVKKLQLESFRLQHERNRQLFKEGLVSEEQVRQSEVAETQAAIELKRLEQASRNAEAANRAELAGLSLEMDKLRKDSVEARKTLDLATARAARDGVVTWTVTEEGGTVRKGDVIARIADLTSFRVDATVPDVYANRLSIGQPVAVRVDEKILEGSIANILPTVQNSSVTVAIALRDRSSALLRSNMRVDVSIVAGHRDRALRVAKGPSTSGEGVQQVFVVRGDRAVRTRLRFGLSGYDRVEVMEGAAAGDTIVVSDMSDYSHLNLIRLR